MYTSTVEKTSRLGIDYKVTTIYKDSKVVKCTYEAVSDINKLQEQSHFSMLKNLAEQNLAFLNTI